MDRIVLTLAISFLFSAAYSQGTKTDILQDPEKTRSTVETTASTATLKASSRLFKDKEDLTSVIVVIPEGSLVDLLPGGDDTFLHVMFEGNEGFIYSSHATINKAPVVASPGVRQLSPVSPSEAQPARPVSGKIASRYEYLEQQYGPSAARKISQRKIWKGMNPEMVKDSWGSPRKINRIINDNTVREEWTYSKTTLYFQNSTLRNWGPAKD
ncbi:MAG: hypothetical protein WAW07_09650 [Bacteroidales bacterium]